MHPQVEKLNVTGNSEPWYSVGSPPAASASPWGLLEMWQLRPLPHDGTRWLVCAPLPEKGCF